MPMDASCNAASEATHRPFQLSSPIFRPMVFDKMEQLVREMQDPENGIPIRSQKLFLTSIPSAFMGYDLVEWIMEHFSIEDSVEAIHLANMLCQHGYFFPIGDGKSLTVKDDSSLYKFQEPCYWPSRRQQPDDVEYAIYLYKRSARTKQKHALDEWEQDELNRIKKNMAAKWDQIMTQGEEQIKLAKDRKKGDKIVTESQERAYWRVYRTPPGIPNTIEQSPTAYLRQNTSDKRKVEKLELKIKLLQSSLNSAQVKSSQAVESLISYCELHCEYEPYLVAPLPSNPWITVDPSLWHFNNSLVDVLTEKRLKKWGLSISELLKDPTGVREFESFLRTEYSHENIRFWKAVENLRNGPNSAVPRTVKEIYEEFLAPGAPCEVNVDGKTIEETLECVRHPSRFTYDKAQEHVYNLMKKDSYPRFMRSDYYKNLLTNAVQPGTQKKKFFSFGIQGKKKVASSSLSSSATPGGIGGANQVSLRRRGSDKSLNEDEKGFSESLSHSHSAGNIPKVDASDVPYSHEDSHEQSDETRKDFNILGTIALEKEEPTKPRTMTQKKLLKSVTIANEPPCLDNEDSERLKSTETDARRRKSEIPTGNACGGAARYFICKEIVAEVTSAIVESPPDIIVPPKQRKNDLQDEEEDDIRLELDSYDDLSQNSQTETDNSPWSSVEMSATCPLAVEESEDPPNGGNDVCTEASKLTIDDCPRDVTPEPKRPDLQSSEFVTSEVTIMDTEGSTYDQPDKSWVSDSDTDIDSFVIGPPPSMTRDMSLTDIPKCPPPPDDSSSQLTDHSSTRPISWESEDNLVCKVKKIEEREEPVSCPPPDGFADKKWDERLPTAETLDAIKVPKKSKIEIRELTPGRVPRSERESRKKKKKLGSKYSMGGSSEALERCYSTELLDRAYKRSFSISCDPQRQQLFSSTDLSCRFTSLSASLSRSDKSVMATCHSPKITKTSVTFAYPTKKTEATQFPPKTIPILKKADDLSLSTHCLAGDQETSNKKVTIVEAKTTVTRVIPKSKSGQEPESETNTDKLTADISMQSQRQSSDSESDPCASSTDICPWEDEENLKLESHPPFVKTYATFGYL